MIDPALRKDLDICREKLDDLQRSSESRFQMADKVAGLADIKSSSRLISAPLKRISSLRRSCLQYLANNASMRSTSSSSSLWASGP